MKGRAVAEDGRIVSRVDRACRGPGNRVHDRARQQVDRRRRAAVATSLNGPPR
jgi:hypothetical protein